MVNIVEVTPIAKIPPAFETLSYFSTKNLTSGDLVSVNFRGKDTPAIVIKTRELGSDKAEIKRLTYKLKPISSIIKGDFLGDNSFAILDKLSRDLFTRKSVLLSCLIPKALLSQKLAQRSDLGVLKAGPQEHRKSALKGPLEDRILNLRTLIREHFARGKSIAIISPRIDALKKLEHELARGIEDYVFMFSSKLSGKKYLSLFNKATTESHPVLILGTHQSLFLGRGDIETIVIEEEGSRYWRDREGIPFDLHRAVEIIAEERGQGLIFSDQILRIETIYRAESGLIETNLSPTGRIQSQVEAKIIEAKSAPFSWITKEFANEIEESIFNDLKILLFVNRKGYSPFTLCQDCSKPQLCPNCSLPLVLHKKERDTAKIRKFICHHCLHEQSVSQTCAYCGSWKLKDFGLGIEKAEEEIAKLFPRAKNITVATEQILSDANLTFDLVMIPSLDYLFTIPDFRINETVFRLITGLKSKARKKIILQTRLLDNKLFACAMSGNISSFYQEEITSRKSLSYPPFSVLIKISREDKNLSALEAEEKKAMKFLEKYNPQSFPAFRQKVRNLFRWNILLKIDPALIESKKDGEKLRAVLEQLSGVWHISVDPNSII